MHDPWFYCLTHLSNASISRNGTIWSKVVQILATSNCVTGSRASLLETFNQDGGMARFIAERVRKCTAEASSMGGGMRGSMASTLKLGMYPSHLGELVEGMGEAW